MEPQGRPVGGAIRFGSSYPRLHDEAVGRSTFCFPDSVFEPVDVGDATILPRLCRMADESGFDDLDECVEAHVHGPVRLDADVAAIVPHSFDPDYRGEHVVELARALGKELTPSTIGDAARSGVHPPQSIKQV